MSKISQLNEQHPKLRVSFINVLRELDPSDTGRYMHFLIRMLYEKMGGKDGVDEAMKKYLTDTLGKKNMAALKKLEEYCQSQALTVDVTQLNSFADVDRYVQGAEEAERLKQLEREEKKWYEDGEWLMVTPYTFEASQMYGRGTKWCTTIQNSFLSYKSGILLYIINRKATKNCKWAIWFKATEFQVYNEQDTRMVDTALIPIPAAIRESIAYVYETFRNHSTDRLFKHFSAEHVLYNKRYCEISKMHPVSATEALATTYKDYVLEQLPEIDQQRVQKLQEAATRPVDPALEKPKKKTDPKPRWKSDDVGVTYDPFYLETILGLR